MNFLEKYGFSEDGIAWVVLGDTYKIKDTLKAEGAKWCNELGWHFSHKNNRSCIKIYVWEVADRNFDNSWTWKPDGKEIAFDKKIHAESEGMEYVGNVGETFNNVVVLKSKRLWGSCFGYQYTYVFNTDDGDEIVWTTSKSFDFEEGKKVRLIGRIKEHKEYHGKKQTYLTRCKMTKER